MTARRILERHEIDDLVDDVGASDDGWTCDACGQERDDAGRLTTGATIRCDVCDAPCGWCGGEGGLDGRPCAACGERDRSCELDYLDGIFDAESPP